MLSFLGTQLLNRPSHVETKVYVKPTNTGLLLLDRAFRLSSNWSYFSEECDRLKLLFFRLKYPDKLINSTISRFIDTKVSDQPVSSPSAVSDSLTLFVVFYHLKTSPELTLFDVNFRIRVTNFTRPCLQCLLAKRLNAILKCEKLSHPLSTSNVSCLQIWMWPVRCRLCWLHISPLTVGQHFCLKHSLAPKDLTNNFRILKKCKSKFDCLVFEMFFINELRPSLNVQSDSLRAKFFK